MEDFLSSPDDPFGLSIDEETTITDEIDVVDTTIVSVKPEPAHSEPAPPMTKEIGDSPPVFYSSYTR